MIKFGQKQRKAERQENTRRKFKFEKSFRISAEFENY